MIGAYYTIDLSSIELPPPLGVWLAVVAWVFLIGSAIGSFLNVVIYRLPRGQSLVHPGSRCPACGHAIRAYDNIPIASWLILRGKCRDCGAAFSSRYMWIEFATGLGFAYLLAIEPLRGMASAWQHGFDTPHFSRFAGLGVLFCTLLTTAFIQFDRQPIPRGLFAFAAIVGLAMAAAFPGWHVLTWSATTTQASVATSPADGLITAIVGAAAGAIFGLLFWPALRRERNPRLASDTIAACAVVGLFLGWQIAAGVIALAAVTYLMIAFKRDGRCPLMTLLATMLLQVPALPLTLRILDALGK